MNSKREIIIGEIQLTREQYYLECIRYGTSKAITEHIQSDKKYEIIESFD